MSAATIRAAIGERIKLWVPTPLSLSFVPNNPQKLMRTAGPPISAQVMDAYAVEVGDPTGNGLWGDDDLTMNGNLIRNYKLSIRRYATTRIYERSEITDEFELLCTNLEAEQTLGGAAIRHWMHPEPSFVVADVIDGHSIWFGIIEVGYAAPYAVDYV